MLTGCEVEKTLELRFYGAAGMVTGSCHELLADGARILVDCGLFQGEDADRNQRLAFDASEVNAVLLTHAHVDHCGRLPCLFHHGYTGKVFCTPGTAELAAITLKDGLHLQDGLYDRSDLDRTLEAVTTFAYGRRFDLPGRVRGSFYDAGHILGSASVLLEGGSSVLFSGDLGPRENPLLGPADPPVRADTVVLEATYGARRHRHRRDVGGRLARAIDEACERGGNVVIPAFAVERTQDLLLALAKLVDQGAIAAEIYVDSPMGIEVTELFCSHREELDPDLDQGGECPLYPRRLKFCRTVDESRRLNDIHHGAVIIASGGMCEGGRIVHHLKRNLPRPECTVLFVGYQARGTLGRRLLDGEESVELLGDNIPVRARLQEVEGLSAHADQHDLMQWLGLVRRPERVVLVHGEKEGLDTLSRRLSQSGYRVKVPAIGDQIPLSG
jgi:metallo-beta-lactamase family protein